MIADLLNPYVKYLEDLRKKIAGKRINPTHEIVNLYYKLNGWEKMPKNFYTGRYAYGKLSREAKELLVACDGNLEDALWAIDKMKYKAERGKFDWSISTCLKHDLNK